MNMQKEKQLLIVEHHQLSQLLYLKHVSDLPDIHLLKKLSITFD